MILYSKNYTWIKKVNGTGFVGLSNYAVKQLGDINHIEPPQMGLKVRQGDVLCYVESTKAASDILAPVSGEVVRINEKVIKDPEILNLSPESDGWIAEVKIENLEELETLMTAEQYKKWGRF